jgi:hypothetical protein
MSDVRLRELERAWQTDREDDRALDRFLDEARRNGLDPVERLGQAGGDEPWAGLLRASIPIVRTQPVGETFGRRLFLFVKSGDQHLLTDVDVFADGAINAWGFSDRTGFSRQLAGHRAPPVVTRVDAGSRISINNLGAADIAKATWLATSADVERAIDMILRVLARPGAKLLDLETDDAEVDENGVRTAALGLSDASPCRPANDGTVRRGAAMPVLVRSGERRAELAFWIVYADGGSQLAPGGPIVPLEEISKRVYSGEVTTKLAGGTTLVLPGLGRIRVSRGVWVVDKNERIREAQDKLDGLRGKGTAVQRCSGAWTEYQRLLVSVGKRPTAKQRRAVDATLERLREAYEAVPEHHRHYLGDWVENDAPIRRVLYPDEAEA